MNLLFSIIPGLASELSASLIDKVRLIFSLWFFSVFKKIGLIQEDFSLQVQYNKFQFTLFLRNIVDLAVLKEVFIDKEYECDLQRQPRIIVDLGAHFGDSSLYFHALYPEALIYAVEPSPENFDRLKKHTATIGNIIPVNIAVGGEDGVMKLNLSKSSLGHSIYEREKDNKTVEVKMLSLKSFMEVYSIKEIDLLKFDIEGAEFRVLRSPSLSSVTYFLGELHFDLDKSVSEEEFTKTLSGFKVQQIPIERQSGRYIIKGSKN